MPHRRPWQLCDSYGFIGRYARRRFSEYYNSKSPSGQTVRVQIASARQHLGLYTSRVNRLHNEDKYRVGFLGDMESFYYGIFDGHGGASCAEFLRDNLHTYIEHARPSSMTKEQKSVVADRWRDDVGGYFRRFKPEFSSTLSGSLNLAFLEADYDYTVRDEGTSGSTASVAMVKSPDGPFWDSSKSVLTVAHVGDTRILLCSVDGRAQPITKNHHPSSPVESERLRKYARAFFTDSFGEERFGMLANTRAFGDVKMKKLGVVAEPEVEEIELEEKYAFMVMCTDGVSDVLSDQEIVDLVKLEKWPDGAAKRIVTCAENIGADDNATSIVIRLKGKVAQRVPLTPGWGTSMNDETKDLREYRLQNEGPISPRRK